MSLNGIPLLQTQNFNVFSPFNILMTLMFSCMNKVLEYTQNIFTYSYSDITARLWYIYESIKRRRRYDTYTISLDTTSKSSERDIINERMQYTVTDKLALNNVEYILYQGYVEDRGMNIVAYLKSRRTIKKVELSGAEQQNRWGRWR